MYTANTHFYNSSINMGSVCFFSLSDTQQSHHLLGCHATRINSSSNFFLSFSNLICLTKTLSWLEKKLKQFAWKKSFFLIVIKITVFIAINSNNQELTHLIHCFRCILYHQSKTKKSCLFHKFVFYDFYFESYS